MRLPLRGSRVESNHAIVWYRAALENQLNQSETAGMTNPEAKMYVGGARSAQDERLGEEAGAAEPE